MYLGKWMIIAGICLVLAGGLVWVLGRMGLPLGRLPGDIHAEGSGGSFHFPVVTCIVVSIVLTVVINVLLRLFGR